MNKVKKIVIITICLFILCGFAGHIVCASQDSVIEESANELGMDTLINELKGYVNSDIDLESMSSRILKGKGIDYGLIGNILFDNLFGEILSTAKGAITILIIIVLMGVVKSLELENDSSVTKITSMVGFLVIVIILSNSYITILKLFSETITNMTGIVQVLSPFLMGLLIATGSVTTGGIVQPIILFVTSFIGIVVNYLIIPMLTVSIVLKIVTNMSSVVKLDKLGSILNSASMWIIGIIFALVLGVISIESTITTSVDSVAVKTTQAAVSNLVPVVGKFVSDSLEVIMGASELIGKTVGVVGIITIVIAVSIPVIKLIGFILIYSIIAAFSEALMADEKISKIIEAFSKQYKTMLGVMIGVLSIFVISIAVIISLMGKVVN